jgi:hypothetical protein
MTSEYSISAASTDDSNFVRTSGVSVVNEKFGIVKSVKFSRDEACICPSFMHVYRPAKAVCDPIDKLVCWRGIILIIFVICKKFFLKLENIFIYLCGL